jgi:hypothetical protein
MITKHLHQVHLAERWNLSPRTLERWRWEKIGPRYLKLGGRVVYRLGRFPTMLDARDAYRVKKQALYPDFYTNDSETLILSSGE